MYFSLQKNAYECNERELCSHTMSIQSWMSGLEHLTATALTLNLTWLHQKLFPVNQNRSTQSHKFS